MSEISKTDIERYKEALEGAQSADKDVAQIEAEILAYKKQAKEEIISLGYSSFSDIELIKARKIELGKQIKEETEKLEAYVRNVNKVKEEKENIMLTKGIE